MCAKSLCVAHVYFKFVDLPTLVSQLLGLQEYIVTSGSILFSQHRICYLMIPFYLFPSLLLYFFKKKPYMKEPGIQFSGRTCLSVICQVLRFSPQHNQTVIIKTKRTCPWLQSPLLSHLLSLDVIEAPFTHPLGTCLCWEISRPKQSHGLLAVGSSCYFQMVAWFGNWNGEGARALWFRP